jgi:predicted  nucleic acid-binding Zn-ribbon protein
MMINEFIERTGFKPTEHYYHAEIEREYEASDMDKDKWCKLWLKNGGIQKAYDAMRKEFEKQECKVQELTFKVETYEKRITFLQDKESNLNERLEDCKQKLNDADNTIERMDADKKIRKAHQMEFFYSLIGANEKASSSEIRELIIDEIGAKDYIRYKLEHNLNLWELDKELIMTLI